jgi:L-amino acid N-acyltransferase YncA
VIIRPATAADAGAVAEIYAHYVQTSTATWTTEAATEEQWRTTVADLAEQGLPFLVLSDEATDAVHGFAYLGTFRARGGWRKTVEDTIYLRPELAGGGHGSRLLSALLGAAEECHATEVLAMICSEAEGSLRLHERLGFREVGRLAGVGHKFGRRLDCVVMQRNLETL